MPLSLRQRAGHSWTSTSHAIDVGALLDVPTDMTTIATAVAPASWRKSTTPPRPEWEISGPAVRKIPRRVLVVDDEPLIRWSVTETLAGLGMDVEQAHDAVSALRAITAAGAFDVVVLDLRLPDMKDLSLLATIRQVVPEASIVLMTAFGTDEIVEKAIALGACSVLNKPFELGTLIDAVYGAAT